MSSAHLQETDRLPLGRNWEEGGRHAREISISLCLFKKQNNRNILNLTTPELRRELNPGDNEGVNSTQVEHESPEVDESEQGDYIGAEEEKPKAQAQICQLLDINLHIILDLHASLPLVSVSDLLPRSILPFTVFLTVISSLLPAMLRHLLPHIWTIVVDP